MMLPDRGDRRARRDRAILGAVSNRRQIKSQLLYFHCPILNAYFSLKLECGNAGSQTLSRYAAPELFNFPTL
jgi:hypothetical protein